MLGLTLFESHSGLEQDGFEQEESQWHTGKLTLQERSPVTEQEPETDLVPLVLLDEAILSPHPGFSQPGFELGNMFFSRRRRALGRTGSLPRIV
jgi:hypothetical protein